MLSSDGNFWEFFDNETMALCMTHLYGSLRRCLTSPDTASSWEKSEIGEKWTRRKSAKERHRRGSDLAPLNLCFESSSRPGILCKNLGIPKIGDKKSAHQARFHSSPINRSPNLVLKLTKFGSSELIQIHPNCQIWLFGSPE